MTVRNRSGFDVVRFAPTAPQVRAEADEVEVEDPEREGVLFGHFSVFNRWYEIDSPWEGNFLERIAPGTFQETFADDVQRCWFEHGYSSTLDRHSLGSIETLREDGTGAYYEVRLFDGLPRYFVDGLAAGEYGASFRMRILSEEIKNDPGESDHNPKGLPEVTITQVRCPEFGPVSIGASPHATANLRCGTDWFYERMSTTDPAAFERARSAADLTESHVGNPAVGVGRGDGEQPTNHTSRSADALLRLAHLHKEPQK